MLREPSPATLCRDAAVQFGERSVVVRLFRTLELPPDPGSCRTARHAVDGCPLGRVRTRADEAKLLVSEFVSNAVRASWGPLTLELGELDEDTFWVTLTSAGPRPCSAPLMDVLTATGHVVSFMDRLSDGWGVHGHDDGLWFIMRAEAQAGVNLRAQRPDVHAHRPPWTRAAVTVEGPPRRAGWDYSDVADRDVNVERTGG